jgi:hypothetical protein
MAFGDDLMHFTVHVRALTQAVFLNTVLAAQASIQSGSAITGSPGQPVGQYGPGYHPGETGGALKASWQVTPETPSMETGALISTDKVYAPDNEYGIRGSDGGAYNQRSSVGGRHSVALTIAGFQRLVDDETRKLA